MRIGATLGEAYAAAGGAGIRGNRFAQMGSNTVREGNNGWIQTGCNMLQKMMEENGEEDIARTDGGEENEDSDKRSEAQKIYEAAFAGEENPIENLRKTPKVPYGYLAKDGVITYNGVVFACDERTNSICLGDMSDSRQVINVTLSGGGHLRVNRANIGDLSKAIGMFSPEDVNLILRAIHQDTKVQSMQKEIEDLENSVGERIVSGGEDPKTEEQS